MTTSAKFAVIASAVSASRERFRAITPPNADSGSQSQALRNALEIESQTAAPQALVCLTTTAAGCANEAAKRHAASASA